MESNLAIITVNYNLKADTADLVQSLLNAGARKAQIYVVDNGSIDGSVEYLRETFGPELNQIETGENRGYAGGLNTALRTLISQDLSWFLLINNDTVVAVDYLRELLGGAAKHPEYTTWGPMILYHSAPSRIWFLGDRLVPGTLLSYHLHSERDCNIPLRDVIPIDFSHGCAMLVHRKVFEKIGLFTEVSLAYAEETDFNWRARLAGFKTAANPRARMWHKISLTAKRNPPKACYLRTRNQILFYRRYGNWFQMSVSFVYLFLRAVVTSIQNLVGGHSELVKPLWLGFWDGWRGISTDRI